MYNKPSRKLDSGPIPLPDLDWLLDLAPGSGQDDNGYRILSFDGGPNTLSYLGCLLALEEQVPGFLARTDLFAGTSDGAFAAAFLAAQPTLDADAIRRCIAMIEEVLRVAVAPNRYPGVHAAARRVARRFGGQAAEKWIDKEGDAPLRALSGLSGAARMVSGSSTWTNHEAMAKVLHEAFGDKKLGELPKPVVIVAYRLAAPPKSGHADDPHQQRPKVFQTIEAHEEPDADESVVEVLLRSAALPLFLPIHDSHIDGGVFANNPSMCAVAAAVEHLSQTDDERDDVLGRVVLLSMGADDTRFGSARVIKELTQTREVRWGWYKWLLHGFLRNFEDMALLVDVVLNSDNAGVHYQAKALLGRRYMRIAPPGHVRTVDKFGDILRGRVDVFLQRARDTAKEWADEAELDSDHRRRDQIAARRQERKNKGAAVARDGTPVALDGTVSIVYAIPWARGYWMQTATARGLNVSDRIRDVVSPMLDALRPGIEADGPRAAPPPRQAPPEGSTP